MPSEKRLLTNQAFRVAAVYAVFAALWILLSDRILAGLVGPQGDLTAWQTVKGWAFVAITAALLYWLIRRELARYRSIERDIWQSEALFRAMFEQATTGNAQLDAEGRILRANSRLSELLGYSSEELASLNVIDLVSPDERETVLQTFDALVSAQIGRYSADRRYRRKDGSTLWVHVTVTPVACGDALLCYLLTVEDISARKEGEVSLAASEANYRRYFSEALVGLGVSGPDRRWLEANDALCDILGYSRTELFSMTWEEMTHPDDLDANMTLFNEAVAGQRDSYRLEKRFIRKDGSVVYTRLATQVLRHPDGSLDRLLTQVEDITEQRLAEQQLRSSEERFRRLVEHLPIMVNAMDENGQFVFWNRECERVTGYTAEEIVGNPRGLTLLYPDPDYLQAILDEWRAIDGDFEDWLMTLTAKDGSQHVVSWTNISIRVPIPGWTSWAIGIDVTRQHEMEHALRESEERYRTLVEDSPLPIVVHIRGEIVFANQAAVVTLAAPDIAAVVGRSVFDFIHPDYHEVVQERIRETLASNHPLRPLEEKFIRMDGQVIDVEVTARMVQYGGEQASQVIFQDITERRQAQQALQRYATRLAALHEIDQAILAAESPEEIARSALRFVKDLVPCQRVSLVAFDFPNQRGRILAAFHEASSELLEGYALPLDQFNLADELWQGKPVVVEDLKAHPFQSPLIQQLTEEGIQAYIVLPLLVQGKLYGMLGIGVSEPHTFGPDEIEVAQEVANQIALALQQATLAAQIRQHASELEQRVAERTKELTIANARLQELDRLKSKFVSDVSHELRAPITNLGMYLHLLERATDLARRDQYLDVLRVQVERLKALVEGILDLSRLDLGKHKVQFSAVDLNAIVQQTVVAHQPRAEAAGLHLEVALDDKIPYVWGERNQLFQVVANLLQNAINYTPEGQVTVQTGFDTRRGQVMLRVSDTGVGIYPEDIPHLFERFYRGQQPQGMDVPGTGLGLGIVKEITDLHSGQIEVESAPGEGTTFTIWLPAASTLQGV
ncbi:MAG: PAS domain S-box protein [Anaerolineae bacterium]